MTVKHTLVSSDMRVFALCSLMELHRYERTAMWGGIGYPSAFFTANEFDFVSRIEDLNEQGRVLCSQGAGRDNKCSKRLTLCM